MSNNYYEPDEINEFDEFDQTENQPTEKPKKNVAGLFIFFSVWKNIAFLPNEELGQLMRAWIEYAETGKTPCISDPYTEATFNFLKSQADSGKERYLSVIEKRRLAGKKGAEARWHKEA